MRRAMLYIVSILIVLALAGCSTVSGASGQPATSTAVPAPTATAPAAVPAPASSTSGQASPTMSSDPAVATVQKVIQKADQEQQNAFAQNNPSLMQDTATDAYYQQLVQINADMANQGVTGIQLVQIEWGPATVTGTSAQATTFETWRTTLSDGSTDQGQDRNVYTLVQQQGAWKIQADDHPDQQQPSGTPPSQPIAPNPTSPAVPTPAPISRTSDVSRNWSGYAATDGTFTAVTGTWAVPESRSTGSPASSATWVGIGGTSGHDLIQAGTEETGDGSSHVQYDAWIEMLPQSSRQVPLTVGPGDAVTVSITGQAGNQWTIAMKNDTTGQTYKTTVTYSSSESSAEWIMEAPSAPRQIVPLDNFGTVQFKSASAVENGRTVTIAQANGQPITMTDARGNVLATPSALTSNGSGFSVTRSAVPSVIQPGPAGGSGTRPGRSFNAPGW